MIYKLQSTTCLPAGKVYSFKKKYPFLFFILFSLFFFLYSSLYSFSQDKTKFNVSGTVAENEIMALEGVIITVYDGFDKLTEHSTSSNGKFSFTLDMYKIYTLEFSKPLFVTKKIELNTEPPENCRNKKTFDFVELPKISLFKIVEGVNYKIYKKPYMYFQYSEKCKFGRDEEHYARVEPLLKKLEDDITAQQKELSKLSSKEAEAKKEETKVAYEQYKTEVKKEEEKEKFKSLSSDEKFKEIIKQGDALWNKGNYEAAKKKYLDALALKPGELYPETQVIRMESLIAEQRKKQKQLGDLALKLKKENEENQPEIAKQETTAKSTGDDLKKEQKKTEALLLKISDDSAVKAANAQLEKQREIEKINDMKSILAHAAAKRIFLEEIADSKMKMKKNGLNL